MEQLAARHVRRAYQRVAAAQVLFAHPVFHLFANDPAFGMPEDQPRPGEVLDREQVELLAQHPVIALLRLFDLVQVRLQVLLREKRRAVDALQLRVLFVAQPVGAGDIQQLERLDLAGRRNVRPAAEVEKLAGFVDRNFFIGLGELLDEVALHEVAFRLEALQPFLMWQKFARVGQVLLDQLLHFLFDLLQILGSKRSLAVEIVEESVLRCRSVSELGFGKEFEHGSSQQVCGGMAIAFERLGIPLGQDAQLGILFQRSSQINQIAVALGEESGVRQTRADGLSNIERGGPLRDFLGAAVGELYVNAVRHR